MLDIIRTMSHSLRVRTFAAVLFLPLVAFVTATSAFGLRCHMTGLVLSTCCCDDSDSEAAKAEPVATVSPANCCDRVVRDVTPAPAETSAATRTLPVQTTPVATIAFDRLATDIVPSALSLRSGARASIGPPTVRLRLVAKSAFLI